MRPTFILFRKNLLMFWRSKPAVVITFLVPLGLIYLFGHIFNLHDASGNAGPSSIRVAVVNASTDPAAAALVDALKTDGSLRILSSTTTSDGTTRPLTEADVRTALQQNDYRFALILPADFLPDDAFGLRLKFLSNPRNEIEAQTVNGLLQKTIFTHIPQVLGQSLQRSAKAAIGEQQLATFNGSLAGLISTHFGFDRAALEQQLASGQLFPTPPPDSPPKTQNPKLETPNPEPQTQNSEAQPKTTPASSSSDFLSRLIRIETEQIAGQEVKNPMAARLVGGYAIMFLLFAVSGSAASFFEEKRSGVFQRLLSSPVRPAHIIWARFLFGVVLGLLQISILFVAGNLFYGLDLLNHAGPLLAVSLGSAAACSAFGLLVTALSPNEAAASGLSTFIVLAMSAVGGAWFPVSFMPDYIQTLSKFTLVYWSVEGFTDVLWAGSPFAVIVPKIAVLLAITATVMAFVLWRLNRHRFFE